MWNSRSEGSEVFVFHISDKIYKKIRFVDKLIHPVFNISRPRNSVIILNNIILYDFYIVAYLSHHFWSLETQATPFLKILKKYIHT